MALADFFTLDLGGQPQVFFPRQDLSDIGTGQAWSCAWSAARLAKRNMSILHERYAPGADTGEEMLTHAGEEGGVVVKGKSSSPSAASRASWGPAMPIISGSSLPHRFRNMGREECEIVSASSPPTF